MRDTIQRSLSRPLFSRVAKLCGIAGICGEDANRPAVLRMLETIRHRGKDDQGIFIDTGVALGCNRLSIIDVPGGRQPVSNQEGTICCVQNGEIYNHNELREELRGLGHAFTTRSDTEVIVEAFEEWGPECFGKLNGMFAAAVWDSRDKTIHLARDRVGVKPLYYSRKGSSLVFGSEMKALLASQVLGPPTVNSRMVSQLIEVGYPLEPETLINEIHQIPPAHRIEYSQTDFTVVRYWTAPRVGEGVPDAKTVRKILEAAIIHQTITSDVPVGAFLSGGLDTSTVVAFSSRARPDGLKTFCMGFNEPTDEFADARLVAETFGTEHHEILVDASDAMRIFPRMVWHSELPKVNLYSWFVNEAASKYVKVCLSGLGGDELFAGYPGTSRFRLADRIARYRGVGKFLVSTGLGNLLPMRMRRLARSLRSEADAYSALITGFPSDEVSGDVKTKVSSYFDGDDGFVQKMVRAEFHTKLPYDYLLVEDAMSMAHTLEVRVPLLDGLLLDMMMPVPYAANVYSTAGKRLLREAVADALPARCTQKPKWGFSVDVYSWWKKSVREYAAKFVPDSSFLKTIAPEWLEKVSHRIALPTDPANTRWYQMAWIMLGLDVWARMFLEDAEPRRLSW